MQCAREIEWVLQVVGDMTSVSVRKSLRESRQHLREDAWFMRAHALIMNDSRMGESFLIFL